MSRGPRALDNPINWSFGVGRLFGVRIRVHVIFLFGAFVLIVRDLRAAEEGAALTALGYGTGTVAILFLIVLLHEFGHCWGARSVGGFAEEILMWPLGGLATVSTPHTAKANLITAVAGPMVNVIICGIIGIVLIAMTGSGWAVPWNPFSATSAYAHATTDLIWWLIVVFQISYVLLLFNLAPVFPLDGGRVLQCLLWPSKGYTEATKIATGVGMVGAIGLALLGFATDQMLIIAIAIFGYFTCWRQRQMLKAGEFGQENEFGYDFSRGYTSLNDDGEPQRKPGYFERRRIARSARRAAREREELERHQRQVDAVLTKISQHGADSLTPAERRILELETQRKRADDAGPAGH